MKNPYNLDSMHIRVWTNADLRVLFLFYRKNDLQKLDGEDIMQLELTKEQYENLVKMLSISNWVLEVLEAVDEEDGDYEKEIEEMQELEQYILSKHADFDSHGKILFEPQMENYITTQEVEDEIVPIMEIYEDYAFWEELTHRMARRDLIEEHGEKKIHEMDPLHRMELEEEFLIKYGEEFSQNGLVRLHIHP